VKDFCDNVRRDIRTDRHLSTANIALVRSMAQVKTEFKFSTNVQQ